MWCRATTPRNRAIKQLVDCMISTRAPAPFCRKRRHGRKTGGGARCQSQQFTGRLFARFKGVVALHHIAFLYFHSVITQCSAVALVPTGYGLVIGVATYKHEA